jgi:Icc-related predicted phosphoesterase
MGGTAGTLITHTTPRGRRQHTTAPRHGRPQHLAGNRPTHTTAHVGFRLLLYGDLHLTPTGRKQPFERPDLAAADVDVVVSVGDVVDDTVDRSGRQARRHERRGRAFFEHLDGFDVPVVAIPGDHDPVDATERLTQGLSNVVVAHRSVLRGADLPGDPDLEGCTLVGVGCEQFDVGPAFPYMAYDTIDPRTTTTHETIGLVADDVADQVEEAVGSYLARERGVDGVADELGVERAARDRLSRHLDALSGRFRELRSLLAEPAGDGLLLSHVPPFNTAFDYRHEFDTLEDRLHRGSIALKMAVAAAAPTVTLCGHVHQEADDLLETVDGGRVAYNAGTPGVAVLDVDPDAGSVDVSADPF